MGCCYGVYFRRSRVAWRDGPGGRRRLAYLRGQRCRSFTGDALAWNFETDDFEAPADISPVIVFRATAIAPAIANCRFGWVFAGHDGSEYLASIEMYARLEALLNG